MWQSAMGDNVYAGVINISKLSPTSMLLLNTMWENVNFKFSEMNKRNQLCLFYLMVISTNINTKRKQ